MAALQVPGLCMGEQLSSLIKLLSGYLATCQDRLDTLEVRLRDQPQPAGASSRHPNAVATCDQSSSVPAASPACASHSADMCKSPANDVPVHTSASDAMTPAAATNRSSAAALVPGAEAISGHAAPASHAGEAVVVTDDVSILPASGNSCQQHEASRPRPRHRPMPTSIAAADADLATHASAQYYHGDSEKVQVQLLDTQPDMDSRGQEQHGNDYRLGSRSLHHFSTGAAEYLTGMCAILEFSLSALADLKD